MLRRTFILAGALALLVPSVASAQSLALEGGHHRGAVPGRRRRRPAGAADRRRACRQARAAVRDRQPRRRQRQHRRRRRRQVGARRLHAAHRHARHRGAEQDGLQDHAVRLRPRLRVDRADREGAAARGGQSEAADQDDGRAGRLRQGQPRQAQFRQHRRRLAGPHHARIAQEAHRHADHPRALSHQRAGQHRHHRGPDRGLHQLRHGHDRPGEGGPDARARHHQQDPLARPARRADARGGRLSRLRVRRAGMRWSPRAARPPTWSARSTPSSTPTSRPMPACRQLNELGMQAAGGTPEDVVAWIKSENERWGPIIKAAGIEM